MTGAAPFVRLREPGWYGGGEVGALLVGRGDELAVVDRLLDAAGGRGGALLLHGEPGSAGRLC